MTVLYLHLHAKTSNDGLSAVREAIDRGELLTAQMLIAHLHVASYFWPPALARRVTARLGDLQAEISLAVDRQHPGAA